MEKESNSVITAAINEVSNTPIALGVLNGDSDQEEDTEKSKETDHA